MAFTPLEIIAFVFALLVIIKIIFIIINKQAWYKSVAKPIYDNIKASGFIFTILAVIIFYFLIRELTITQIFAALAFSSLLIALGLLQWKDIGSLVKKAYSQKFNIWTWLYIIVFLILVLWVLYEILF